MTLELGPEFTAGPVESKAEQLAFAASRTGLPEIEVVVASPGLGERRVLGRLPGHLLIVGTIVGSRLRKKVYVAGEEGIWEFPLAGGEPSLVVGLPDLPAASQVEVQQAYGANPKFENWVPHTEGQSSYRWILALDEDAHRLFAHSGQEGALDHLVEISLDSRTFTSRTRMPGFCGGIEVDVKRRRIFLPAVEHGAQLLDFAGHQLAVWRDGEEHPSGRFWDAAIRPADGTLALAEYDGGLWLWDPEHNQQTKLADDAAAPCWSSSGAVFFMRTSAELWMVEKDRPAVLIVRALGDEGGTEAERRRNWVMRPRLSNDGRFLLAQLTALRKTNTAEVADHDAVVVDLIARRVQQVRGFFEHTICWF